MYIVFFRVGSVTSWLSTWSDYYDAYKEVESLSKRDSKATYFVEYRETF